MVKRGELSIAVSTSAKCPGLARELRLELEQNYGPEYAEYVEILGAIRNKLLKDKQKYDKKERLLSELFVSGIPDLLRIGAISELDKLLISILGQGYSLASLGTGIKGVVDGCDPTLHNRCFISRQHACLCGVSCYA